MPDGNLRLADNFRRLHDAAIASREAEDAGPRHLSGHPDVSLEKARARHQEALRLLEMRLPGFYPGPGIHLGVMPTLVALRKRPFS
jgi:hypothetical protein